MRGARLAATLPLLDSVPPREHLSAAPAAPTAPPRSRPRVGIKRLEPSSPHQLHGVGFVDHLPRAVDAPATLACLDVPVAWGHFPAARRADREPRLVITGIGHERLKASGPHDLGCLALVYRSVRRTPATPSLAVKNATETRTDLPAAGAASAQPWNVAPGVRDQRLKAYRSHRFRRLGGIGRVACAVLAGGAAALDVVVPRRRLSPAVDAPAQPRLGASPRPFVNRLKPSGPHDLHRVGRIDGPPSAVATSPTPRQDRPEVWVNLLATRPAPTQPRGLLRPGERDKRLEARLPHRLLCNHRRRAA